MPDKWNTLSLRDKVKAIKIMVAYGITHPSEIRNLFNAMSEPKEDKQQENQVEITTEGPAMNEALNNPLYTQKYEDLSPVAKEHINSIALEYNIGPDKVEEYYNNGYLNPVIKARFQVEGSGRKKGNDSKTKESSEYLEGQMNSIVYNRTDQAQGKMSRPNLNYAIPYLEDKEIKVSGVGRVTENALDSLAKYALLTDLPLSEALGLSAQETQFGAIPYINYGSYDKIGYSDIASSSKEFDTMLGNTSYFRNYGIIPAEYLVRDFAYGLDKVDSNVPPLQHAFEYYKAGKYNPNDPNHTSDVQERGREVMSTPAIQDWISRSDYAKAALENEAKLKEKTLNDE